jgi:hypothetical protein
MRRIAITGVDETYDIGAASITGVDEAYNIGAAGYYNMGYSIYLAYMCLIP